MSLDAITSFLAAAAPFFPRFGADVTVLTLLFLFWGAFSDALSGRIPNLSVYLGSACIVSILLIDAPWSVISHQLSEAFLLGLGIWALNELYFFFRRHDALGFGDVKWSFLAALAFGIKPVLYAWVIASWLGLAWMGVRHILPVRKTNASNELPVAYIHFSPFLLLGLLFALGGLGWK